MGRREEWLYFAINCQNQSDCFSEQMNYVNKAFPESLSHMQNSRALASSCPPGHQTASRSQEKQQRDLTVKRWHESVHLKHAILKGKGLTLFIRCRVRKVLYCMAETSKRQTNKNQTTVNSDAKIPKDQRQRWRQNCFVVLEIILQASASNLSARVEPKKIAFSFSLSSIFSGFSGLFCKLGVVEEIGHWPYPRSQHPTVGSG